MTLVRRGRAGPRAGLSGAGARRLRRRRHRGRGAGRDAGDAGRFRIRHARGQCRRRGRGRQARHRDASRSPNCARAFCRRRRWRPKRRSCSTGRCSTSISPNGGGRACASASPMAASICCIPATSSCWPARARPATGWWWGSNSDASVTRLKGEGRPVQHAQARAEVLAALEAVDLVVVFDEDTPLELIERVKPTVLVKGGDYTPRPGGRPRDRRGARRRGDAGRSGARPFDHEHGRALAQRPLEPGFRSGLLSGGCPACVSS